jgi:S-disulfanyl-L-cysteine oxidoreductase SoxD
LTGLKAYAVVLAGFAIVGELVLSSSSPAQAANPQPSPTPETRSVWDGVYTEKQAARGQDVYHENCSSCHGDKLTGKADEDVPALVGDRFHDLWDDRKVGDLFKKIRRTMPQDDPGRLTEQQAADVVAFLLSANKYPPGETELPVDQAALTRIMIPGAKPGSPAKDKPADRSLQ